MQRGFCAWPYLFRVTVDLEWVHSTHNHIHTWHKTRIWSRPQWVAISWSATEISHRDQENVLALAFPHTRLFWIRLILHSFRRKSEWILLYGSKGWKGKYRFVCVHYVLQINSLIHNNSIMIPYPHFYRWRNKANHVKENIEVDWGLIEWDFECHHWQLNFIRCGGGTEMVLKGSCETICKWLRHFGEQLGSI